MRHVLICLACTAALGLAACGDDSDEPKKDSAGTVTAQTATSAEPPPSEGCQGVEAPQPKGEQSLKAPDDDLDPKKTWIVALETNCGTIQITLDTKRAPKTSASVAALVKDKFYDGLTFHRIGRGPDGGEFVIQGGDPLGNGQGGPGYSVTEKPPADVRYTRGVVAMAKTQLEDAGTSGSQFYIVTAADAGLPADYAVLGKVTKGDDVVSRIAAAGADADTEQPTSPIVISRATLRSR